MILYNKSGRAFIIDVKYITNGGRFSEFDTKKDRKYFDPNTDLEVTDEYGKKLLGMYPKELKRFDSPEKKVETPKKRKSTIKKKTTKKSKKG